MFLDGLWRSLDPVAFSLGAVEVRWYGLAYLLGVVVSLAGLHATSRRWGLRLSYDAISIIVTAGFLGLLLGARLGYAVAYGGGYYLSHPLEVLQPWHGGMSFHGGLVGLACAVALACRWLRVSAWTVLDMVATWIPLALLAGRCANFANGELWGAECDPSLVPWAVAFDSGGGVWRHPSQLYEALLEGLLLFAVMRILAARRPVLPQRAFCGVFLAWYGAARFLLEFVRVPDAQVGYLAGGWLTMGQLLSVPMVVGGAWLVRAALAENIPQHAFADGRDAGGGCDEVAGDVWGRESADSDAGR